MYIYMSVNFLGGAIPFPKIMPFIYNLFFLKKGVYHIPGGAEKGGFWYAHPYYVIYIGYLPLRGFKPFMMQNLLKRRYISTMTMS